MRLLSLVLALSCIIATAAAAWQPQEFVIGGWAGPPPSHNTLETWQRVTDCNFTFCGVRGGYSVEQNRTMLDLCQQAGTRALLVDSRIHWSMVRDDDWRDTVSAIVARISRDEGHSFAAPVTIDRTDTEDIQIAYPTMVSLEPDRTGVLVLYHYQPGYIERLTDNDAEIRQARLTVTSADTGDKSADGA
ncbi:MAG: hypothetical protein ACP5KN_12250 [Armatimonadota bacterium]